MELSKARSIAAAVVEQLSPYCDRICIAGSIRREVPTVGDIEILAIPKKVTAYDMFNAKIGSQHNAMFQQIVKKELGVLLKGDVANGRYFQIRLNQGIYLDLFCANPLNWGYLLVIRTGSAEFSKRMASRWSKFGYKGMDGMLTCGGTDIILREEEDLFKLLNLPYVDPVKRIS